MAHRQRDDEAPGIVGVDGEERRGRARGREGGAVVRATGHLTVRVSRQEALVERNRPVGASQRIGNRRLPVRAGA